MTVQQLYDQYRIPPNLQRHMKEVTAVGLWIVDHWTGQELDVDILKKSLLTHDLGNIIKFKKPFMGELTQDEAYWEQVQQEYIEKYGSDVFAATVAILRESGLTPKIIDILTEMKEIGEGKEGQYSWEARIADLADTCVTPEGIVGFETRVLDLCQRYQKELHSEWTTALRKNRQAVETQMTNTVDDLSPQECEKYWEGLDALLL